MAKRWRRFLPKKLAPSQKPTSDSTATLRTVRTIDDANAFVEVLKQKTEPSDIYEKLAFYRTLLIAQTPQAVLAQWQMDAHKHGYHNREKRLYELIDFNDTFVNLVLLTPLHKRAGLTESLKSEMDQFCRKLQTPAFSAEQFDAIARGLGREIAVFTAAEQLGYSVHMTSRTQDAFGIDMVVTYPEAHKRLYIDCKTPSAFRHRLEDLLKYHDISEGQLLRADQDDFLTMERHHNDEVIPVTLLCIRPDTVGEIHDFAFDEPARLGALLERVFAKTDSSVAMDIFTKKW